MNEREKGAMREKAAMEVLRKKHFTIPATSSVNKQRGYDFDASKDGQQYVVEVKGGNPEKNKNVPGLSLEQMKTLANYRRKGYKALLMFVIHNECSIFELVDDSIPVPETSQT